MRLLPHWDHSVLSPPLGPWDRSALCLPWVHSDRSHLEVHLDPWLLPVQRDPPDLRDLLRLWILPDHWDQQDRSGPSHPWVR